MFFDDDNIQENEETKEKQNFDKIFICLVLFQVFCLFLLFLI